MSGSNTLPTNRDKITTGTSNTSLYDTVGVNSDKNKQSITSIKLMKDRETATPGGKISSHVMVNAQTSVYATTTSTSTTAISGIASQTEDVSIHYLIIFNGHFLELHGNYYFV